MKKKLLLPSLLLTHMLLSTACVQTESTKIKHTEIHQTETATETVTRPIVSTPAEPSIIDDQPQINSSISSATNGIKHQLPTVQGDSITIIENGNVGFEFPQYQGKVIIFQIFGKDCEYCKKEMPILNKVKNDFSNNIEVVAIQAQGRMLPSVASNILRQYNIHYPIIEGDDAKDILRFLAETYTWTGVLPYTLLVKDGKTEITFPDGGVEYQELKESIENLL